MTPQAIIEDSGSTNVRGVRVTVGSDGQANIEPRDGQAQHVNLSRSMCEQLLRDLKEAGPLDQLPTRHCIKSVSFGSRITIEYNGATSPDLSCPATGNSHLEALQKDARAILESARSAAGIRSRRTFTVPAPHPPKS